MGVFSRMTDIINANLNSLLDKAEDPEKMIRLMIMEMEETLVEVRSSSARLLADEKTLSRRREKLMMLASDWEGKAELALVKGRDDLAKAALVEKRKVEESIDIADEELSQIQVSVASLNEELSLLQAKLKDAKAKQKTLLMRHATANKRIEVRKHLHSETIDNAMKKFERYERKLDELEGEVESYDLGKSLSEEINELESDDKINDELAALKAKLAKKDD